MLLVGGLGAGGGGGGGSWLCREQEASVCGGVEGKDNRSHWQSYLSIKHFSASGQRFHFLRLSVAPLVKIKCHFVFYRTSGSVLHAYISKL